MKKFESELFENAFEPETFLELMELATSNIGNEHNQVKPIRMWRGQGDIRWAINSGAYRRIYESKIKGMLSGSFKSMADRDIVEEEDVSSYESILINQAKHKGFHYIDGKIISDFELLARLQHHGAATRLVDFSKNLLVSLWFCVDSSPNETGLLLGLLNTNFGGDIEDSIMHTKTDYQQFVENLKAFSHPLFIEPPIVSSRISSQHGVFLYSDVVHEKTGSLKLGTYTQGRLFIAVSPSLKKVIRDILITTFDIRQRTLFPDFEGFCLSNSVENNIEAMLRQVKSE
ncbi:FRG domain-containing protein [Paenibacillus sp. LMG 31460]|uniref:FRG domain-containing protein n=1 Tax=Paenibacillus germinis TaxID=2654979 RepID=A0ABX1Z2T3_9BACL|nr:FRG domain-containing protein [Paenibacillus germinis]NOU86210.1 FRG domain-containing protein [Paenibacillus germinis]